MTVHCQNRYACCAVYCLAKIYPYLVILKHDHLNKVYGIRDTQQLKALVRSVLRSSESISMAQSSPYIPLAVKFAPPAQKYSHFVPGKCWGVVMFVN